MHRIEHTAVFSESCPIEMDWWIGWRFVRNQVWISVLVCNDFYVRIFLLALKLCRISFCRFIGFTASEDANVYFGVDCILQTKKETQVVYFDKISTYTDMHRFEQISFALKQNKFIFQVYIPECDIGYTTQPRCSVAFVYSREYKSVYTTNFTFSTIQISRKFSKEQFWYAAVPAINCIQQLVSNNWRRYGISASRK